MKVIEDQIAIARLNEKLDLKVSDHNIDGVNRIGTVIPTRTKPRLIIVKFVMYADRDKVFTNKKRLKNSGIIMT